MFSVWAVSLALFFSGNGVVTVFSKDPVDTPLKVGKLIIYPNPATTEINIELNNGSFVDGIISVKDLAGRKYIILPVKGRENFVIHLDKRFVRGLRG